MDIPQRARQACNALVQRVSALAQADVGRPLSNLAWLNIGSGGVALSSLLLSVGLARLASPHTYGSYGLTWSVLGVLSVFAIPGMDAALVRTVARGADGTVPKAMRIKAIGSLAGSAGCVVVAFCWPGVEPLVQKSLLLAAFLLVPLHVLPTALTLLDGKQMFRLKAIYGISARWGQVLTILVVAALGMPAEAVIGTSVGAAATGNFFIYLLARRERKNNRVDPEGLRYGYHLGAASTLGVLAVYADRILMGLLVGPASLAAYMVALAIPLRANNLFRLLGHATLPKMSTSAPSRLAAWFRANALRMHLVGLGIGLAGALLAPIVIWALYPAEGYTLSRPASALLTFAYGVSAPQYLTRSAIQAAADVRRTYTYSVAIPLISIILFTIAASLWGFWGLVAARAAATLVTSLWLTATVTNLGVVNGEA